MARERDQGGHLYQGPIANVESGWRKIPPARDLEQHHKDETGGDGNGSEVEEGESSEFQHDVR